MTQHTLFTDMIDKAKDGAIWWAGNWQCRNWHGYIQSREGGTGNWCFQVGGFSGPEDGNGIAHVCIIRADESLAVSPQPIDANNRILIEGKRYGRSHWNH